MVVRFGGNAFDFLGGEGQPNGNWALRRKRGQRGIVIPGAIADAMPGAIECGERYQKEVWLRLSGIGRRLLQAKRAVDECVAGAPEVEGEGLAASGEARQGSREAGRRKLGEKRPGKTSA